jgi:hypothetical protein
LCMALTLLVTSTSGQGELGSSTYDADLLIPVEGYPDNKIYLIASEDKDGETYYIARMDFPPEDNLGADLLLEWTWKLADGSDYSEHIVLNFPRVTAPNRRFSIIKVGKGLIDPSGETVKKMNVAWFTRTSKDNFWDTNQQNGPGGSNYNENEYWTWVREIVDSDFRFQNFDFILKRREPHNDQMTLRAGLYYYERCSQFDQVCLDAVKA